MYRSQTSFSAQLRLMSARSAKRWGRWFVFAWLGMWISSALLPCCEVAAAVASHEQAQHPDCGHASNPASDPAPESGGGHKSAACLDVAAPAPVAAEILASPSADKFTQQVLLVSALFHILPPPRTLSPVAAYRAAPPPLAVHLRSTRLLI
jgi:hypothetical protein